jgi:hypothetical protein
MLYSVELRSHAVLPDGKSKAKTVAGKIIICSIKPGFRINSAFPLLLALPYEIAFLGHRKKS